jgi:hypothetical protein
MTDRYEDLYYASMGNSPAKLSLNFGTETQNAPVSLEQIIGMLHNHPGFEKIKPKDLLSLNPSNDATIAIEIMAETRAYFQGKPI